MSTPRLTSVAIGMLAAVAQLTADEPVAAPPAQAGESQTPPETTPAVRSMINLVRSVRIVRDLAEFDMLKLKPQKEGAWIVARIRPGGLSGALHNQGMYIEAETGRVVDRGIRPMHVVLVGGQWKRLELLSGEAPKEGRFEWKEPYVEHAWDRNFSIYDSYSVFTAAHVDVTVICRFFADRKGAEQFSDVTPIPDDWQAFAKPAYEYHVRHADDFARYDPAELRKLASGKNPFIALTALRRLVGRENTDEEIERLSDLAHALPKYRQAVLVLWLLKQKDDESRNVILKAADRATSKAELTGLALGIESWTASHSRFLFDPGSTQIVRDKLVEKWRGLDPRVGDEESWKTWQRILAGAGTRESNSNR